MQRYLGVFAEVLHIPPWDIGKLTTDEFDALVGYLETRGGD